MCRVSQARSLCSEGSLSCQFGYTFREEGGRERTLVFVPPREEEEAGSRSRTSTSPTSQPAGQEKTTSRRQRGRRINIDPRRNKNRPAARNLVLPVNRTTDENIRKGPNLELVTTRPKVTTTKTTVTSQRPRESTNRPVDVKKPVTIIIGGEEFVIPDFGSSPEESRKIFSVTTQAPTITVGGKSFIIPDFAIKFNQNRRKRPQRTTTEKPNESRDRNESSDQTESSLISFSSLSSVLGAEEDTRDVTRSGSGGGGGSRARGFVRSREQTSTSRPAQQPTTASRRLRGPGSPERQLVGRRRKQSDVGGQSSSKARVSGSSNTRDPGSSVLRQESSSSKKEASSSTEEPEALDAVCPGNLDSCVTSCVPLQDVYVYSACVVACGKRC